MPQKFDVVEQNAIIDSYVAKGFNGFAFQPDDPVASNQKIQELKDLGIPVLSIAGCPSQPSPSLFCLTTDTKDLAYQGAKHLMEAMGGKGNIVHFTGQPEDTNTKNSIDGVAAAAKEFPGIKILQDVVGMDAGPEAAQTGVSNVLAARKGEIGGIISTSGIATDVIANEFRKTNQTGDQVRRPQQLPGHPRRDQGRLRHRHDGAEPLRPSVPRHLLAEAPDRRLQVQGQGLLHQHRPPLHHQGQPRDAGRRPVEGHLRPRQGLEGQVLRLPVVALAA